MTDALSLALARSHTYQGVLVVLCDVGLILCRDQEGDWLCGRRGTRVAKAERFTGKKNSTLDLTVPPGSRCPVSPS